MTKLSIPTDNILPLIHTIRGQRVILAADLASLYGVETRKLNQQIKRNLERPQAVAMGVFIVRAFVQQREVIAANDAILKRLAEIDKTLLQHNAALRDVYQKLLPLLQPPPDPPKPKIGFREKSPRYGSKRSSLLQKSC
jgi:hypothetical protein